MIREGIYIVCVLAIWYFVAMPLLLRFGTSTNLKPRELLVLRGFASTLGISEVRLRSIVREGLAAQQFAEEETVPWKEHAMKEWYLEYSGANPAAQEVRDVLEKMGLGRRALQAFAVRDCVDGIDSLSTLMEEEKRRSLRARIGRVVRSKEVAAAPSLEQRAPISTEIATPEDAERNYPRPDRSSVPPNFKKSAENDVIDIMWGEGEMSDGRPFRVECWAQDQITSLTYFFSTKRLEYATKDEISCLLEREGLIEFTGEQRYVAPAKFIDSGGNEMWSVNVVVGDEDETFVADHFPLHPYPK